MNDIMMQGRDANGKWGAAYWHPTMAAAQKAAQEYANERQVKVRLCEWTESGKKYQYFEPQGVVA